MLQFPLRLLAWHQQIASIMMVARRLEIQGIMLYQNIRNITNAAGMHRSTCEYVIAYCTKVSLRSPPLSSTTKPTCLILGYIPYYIDCNSSRSVFPCCIRFHFTVRFFFFNEARGTAHAIPNAIVVGSLDTSRCFTTILSHPRTRVTNMSEMSDRLLEWCKGHSEIPDRSAVFVLDTSHAFIG